VTEWQATAHVHCCMCFLWRRRREAPWAEAEVPKCPRLNVAVDVAGGGINTRQAQKSAPLMTQGSGGSTSVGGKQPGPQLTCAHVHAYQYKMYPYKTHRSRINLVNVVQHHHAASFALQGIGVALGKTI
jgi:hypothetical protein